MFEFQNRQGFIVAGSHETFKCLSISPLCFLIFQNQLIIFQLVFMTSCRGNEGGSGELPLLFGVRPLSPKCATPTRPLEKACYTVPEYINLYYVVAIKCRIVDRGR